MNNAGVIFTFLPQWADYLIGGIALLILLVTSGIAIGKTGRHPIWALALLVPGVQIIVIWAWAYGRWPARDASQM